MTPVHMASALPQATYENVLHSEEHRFLLVDDHPLYAEGFASAIQRLYPCASLTHASSGKEAQSLLRAEAFDLVFLDVHLPDMNGLSLLGEQLRQGVWQPVAMLTGRPDASIIEQAKHWGAVGVISKRNDLDRLHTICEKILKGGKYYERESVEGGAVVFQSAPNTLTLREFEVLRTLAEGSENSTICQMLGISNSTLKTHLRSLFQKLDVSNRTACVIKGLREGLI